MSNPDQAGAGEQFLAHLLEAECPASLSAGILTLESGQTVDLPTVAQAITRLEKMSNRIASLMRDYTLPEEVNGIICSELDAANEVLDYLAATAIQQRS